MDGLIGIAGVLALLLGVGTALGLLRRDRFSFRWLLAAATLVLVEDVLLTCGYGLVPSLFPGQLNWFGKLVALGVLLGIAALPAFGWRASAVTLRQRAGSLRAVAPVVALYVAFLFALAFAFPNDPPTAEDIAFQLTLPGLEEELFYRGVLLLALDRAFAGRVRLGGVDWGWGALLSCALFGLTHAFGHGAGGFTFDPLYFALTAGPSLVAVWLRYRTGSLLLPVLLHDLGNILALLL